MAEERVPAGWYPDPSGLPQLRWWDNHKWTEFVSDSQLEQEAQVEEVTPVVTPTESRPAIESPAPHAPADLGSAFDALLGDTSLTAERTPDPEPRLAAAFDAAFGPVDPEPVRDEPRFEEPRFVAPGRHSEPASVPEADPLESMFASSATSPVGVGTGETIGEALMRALQSA